MFDFKDMALKAIHDIGGCDATDEWSKGYDAGVNAAIAEVAKLAREDARIEFIAKHYGFTSQANMLCEESAEYMVALNKLRRGKPEAYANVKEEVADIIVVAMQLRYLLGADEIDRIISEKLDRQLNRIHEENAWVEEQLKKLNIKMDDKLTKEFWERKVNEPPTDKCVDEAGWADFGKKAMKK